MKSSSRNSLFSVAALAFVTLLSAGGAQAGITQFSAQDDGAPVGGPFPNSAAAETSFLSAASTYGAVYTETFEELAVGTGGGGGDFAIQGATVSLDTTYAAPYGGVNNAVSSNVYGFNVTPGGSNWLGFADGSATFTFDQPTNSFGFYTTGVQTVFTSDLSVTFDDGTSEDLSLPINVNGGASYFGFTDSVGVSSVTITDISDDAWGIDDVSYNVSAAPEPGAWAMMLLGIGLTGGLLRLRARIGREIGGLPSAAAA